MADNKVAVRYAKSLFEVAEENNTLKQVHQNMADFEETCNANDDLKLALKSPIVSSNQKKSLLSKVFVSYEKEVLNFFNLVTSKNRSGYLPQIANQFGVLYNQSKNIVEVSVQSAQALTDTERADMVSFLEKETGAKEIKIAESISPDLLGGLVIKYGDTLIDSSVLSQINNLKKELQIV